MEIPPIAGIGVRVAHLERLLGGVFRVKQGDGERDALDGDATDKILIALARAHPYRPDRDQIIGNILEAENEISNPTVKANLAKRLGKLISNKIVEERLTLNDLAPKIGLSGRALIGVSLNIEALRDNNKSQHDVIDEIINETSNWVTTIDTDSSVLPPVVIRDISIVHGSDQFDILITVLHSKKTLQIPERNEREEVIYYYVREVIQRRVSGVNGTKTMGLASSKAYPMET